MLQQLHHLRMPILARVVDCQEPERVAHGRIGAVDQEIRDNRQMPRVRGRAQRRSTLWVQRIHFRATRDQKLDTLHRAEQRRDMQQGRALNGRTHTRTSINQLTHDGVVSFDKR